MRGGRRPGRAEGQVELAPESAAFWRLDFGGDDDSLVLLADNYSLTITNITAEAQNTQRTNGRRRLLLRYSELFFQVFINK